MVAKVGKATRYMVIPGKPVGGFVPKAGIICNVLP